MTVDTVLQWRTDPPSGVCWARHAEHGVAGCFVAEAEKPSEGEPRWVYFVGWGGSLSDCVAEGYVFAPIPKPVETAP